MNPYQPKRCKYDELGGICNVPISDDATFCENHVQKSRDTKLACCVVIGIGLILFLGVVICGNCGTP